AIMCRPVYGPVTAEPRADAPREGTPLAPLDEYVLPRCARDRPHPVHAAHVVDAVHLRDPLVGGVTVATPIIESRVTSWASASSLRPSVSSGRSGSTR